MATMMTDITPQQDEPDEERLMAILETMRQEPTYCTPKDTKRLEKAEMLYREGKVTPGDTPGIVHVADSDDGTVYTIDATCPCAYAKGQKDKWCSHRIAAAIYRKVHAAFRTEGAPPEPPRAEETLPDGEGASPLPLDDEMRKIYRQTIVKQLKTLGITPTSKEAFADAIMKQVGLVLTPDNFPRITERLSDIITTRTRHQAPPVPEQYLVDIKGKKHILFAGLLAMAHEQGLQALDAEFISVTDQLALAKATATFANGQRFTEAGDATPGNVGPQVKPHFARMALTRAKARCLRDALNIQAVSAEEVE
jgi:hypothetical protein